MKYRPAWKEARYAGQSAAQRAIGSSQMSDDPVHELLAGKVQCRVCGEWKTPDEMRKKKYRKLGIERTCKSLPMYASENTRNAGDPKQREDRIMPTPKTSITLDPRILAEIDRRTEKFSGKGNRSALISRHLDRYFSMLARARRELRELLNDSETMLIVDVLNGVPKADPVGIYMVSHEVADGISLDHLDEKWKVDGKVLVEKLNGLNDAQHLALIDSVTMWWNRVAEGEQPAHTKAEVFKEPPRKELEVELP